MSVPDYALEETVDFKFTSRAFATGVPTTLAGTPAVEIYEDSDLTQITAGITLTADFDGVTGLNRLSIAATTANGFEAGKSYQAVISAGTVSSVSVVGEVVAQFSIQRRPVNWANVTAPTTAVDLSATDIQLCDTITTYTGNTVQTGDTYALANGATGFVAIDTVVDAILVDTGTTLPATLATIAGYIDTEVAAIKAVTDAIPDSGAMTSIAQASAVAAAQTDLDTITDTGVTTVALTTAAITDVWSTDTLTEAYAADGAAGTPAELLYMLWAAVGEFSISSTTLTAKKLDGSTTAMTFTLSDATSPTSRTRAT